MQQASALARATSSARAPGDVDQLARPAACASTSAGAWRSCGCGASSPRRRRRAARSKPSALRAVSRGAGGVRARGPRRPPRPRPSRRRARRCARTSASRSIVEADEQRRVARVGGPQLRSGRSGGSARRRRAARARARCRCAVARVDPLRGPRRAPRQLGVQRLRRRARSSSAPSARARLVGRRRAQVELGERGAQVQAGAADDDRRGGRRRAARRSRRARARAYSPALNVASTGRNDDAAGARAAPAPRALAAPVRISSPR